MNTGVNQQGSQNKELEWSGSRQLFYYDKEFTAVGEESQRARARARHFGTVSSRIQQQYYMYALPLCDAVNNKRLPV